MKLYQMHDMAYQAAWSNLVQSTLHLGPLFVGAPGGLTEVLSAGHRYAVHQFFTSTGKRRQVTLGNPQDPETKKMLAQLADRIEATKEVIEQVRILAKIGYQIADNKTYGVMAVLHNAGLFERGLTIIGSHAYGALVNTLGIKIISYKTDDIDLTRRHKLAVESMDIAKMLAATEIDFVPVPAFKRNDPSTSLKERGTSRFQVDLLVPSSTEAISTAHVPELNIYATSLPYLNYLLEDTWMVTLASRHGAAPIRVPDPARFAVHKMLVSQLRINMPDKAAKDIDQACVLLAMLGEHRPGETERAIEALPDTAMKYLANAVRFVETKLKGTHDDAIHELRESVGRRQT